LNLLFILLREIINLTNPKIIKFIFATLLIGCQFIFRHMPNFAPSID
jgi:hypothetical protein